MCPLSSPRTRQRARATEYFPRFPVIVADVEPDSHELHGVLYSKKKITLMADQWAQHDATVEALILKEGEWSITTPEEKLDFFCS